MSLLLIMNPGSRAGKGKRLWSIWEAGLRQAGVEYQCVYTEYAGHAFELARTANGFKTVVAVGGDGTINEVLDGVTQSGDSSLSMGVLYSGTSPDFCRFHRIPLEPTRAVSALLTGKAREIDVVRISFVDAEGNPRTAHYCCSSNIGMGADIARYANRWRRFLGDTAGTGAALLRSLLLSKRLDLEVEADGEHFELPELNNLSIVKNPYIASGLKMQLDLRPDDGKLWVVGIYGKSPLGMIRVIPKCYSGSVTGLPGVLVKRCSSVKVRAKEKQEIEFDGDPRGMLPITVEIMPRALKLIGGSYE